VDLGGDCIVALAAVSALMLIDLFERQRLPVGAMPQVDTPLIHLYPSLLVPCGSRSGAATGNTEMNLSTAK
jgi:hypothetical protein